MVKGIKVNNLEFLKEKKNSFIKGFIADVKKFNISVGLQKNRKKKLILTKNIL